MSESSRRAAWLSLGVALFLPATAWATTYDVGPGMPYTTLSGLPTLVAGDVVQIHPGTYNEARRFTVDATSANPIIIRGVGSTRPVFDGTGVPVTGSGSAERRWYGSRRHAWLGRRSRRCERKRRSDVERRSKR